MVARICKLDHSLIPNLGCRGPQWRYVPFHLGYYISHSQDYVMFGVITISFGLYTHLGSVLFWVVSSSSSLFIFNGRATFRKSILDLHQRFQCGSGWGLERTLNAWVIKQPWRQRLPLSFFETLFFTQSMFFLHHWKKMGRSFLETMIVNTTEVRC